MIEFLRRLPRMPEHRWLLARHYYPYPLSDAPPQERERDAERRLEDPPPTLEPRLFAPISPDRPREFAYLFARGRDARAGLPGRARHR